MVSARSTATWVSRSTPSLGRPAAGWELLSPPSESQPAARTSHAQSAAAWCRGLSGMGLPAQRRRGRRTGTRGSGRQINALWHADAEVCAAKFAVHDLNRAPMRLHELLHHGQADAGTAHVAAGR